MSTLILAPRTQAASKLGSREALSYAVGEVGGQVWNMFAAFLAFYYTNVALLPVAAVGTLMLLTRIFDALFDPLVGVLVDKTHSAMGRARPWLFYATGPFMLLCVLTFSVPAWSAPAKIVYAYVTFGLVGVLFSALYVPFTALLPLMTSDPAEKLRIGSYRAIGASLGSMLVYFFFQRLVDSTGNGHLASGYSLASAVMATGFGAAMVLVLTQCRERQAGGERSAPEPFRQGLRDMLRNPVWLVLAGFAFAMMLRVGALVSVTIYFAMDVLHDPTMIAWLLSSLSVSMIVGGLLARPVLAKFGKRRGNIAALLFVLVMTVIERLVLHHSAAFVAIYCVANVSLGIQSTTIFAMIPDSVDAQERRFGSRNEGLLSSAASLALKVGTAFGGALILFGLAAFNYDAHAVTDGARSGITLLYFGVPAIFAIVQIIVIGFYNEEML